MDLNLDPKFTALILIDLQGAIVGRQTAPHAPDHVLRNASRLATAVREKDATVVYVRVMIGETLRPPVDAPMPRPSGSLPADATEIVPEAGMQPGDLLVTKRQWGAFYATDLEQHLRRRGIRTIILGGIATNMGVESTARAAFDQGFELVFAEDAMTSVTAEAHAFAVGTMFPRMGRVRSTEQIIAALG